MSCLENEIIEEKLSAAFDDALWTDPLLQDYIVYAILEPLDYFSLSKEEASDAVDWDQVYEKINEAFYNSEGCFDIRALAEKAYGIEI